MAQIIGSVTGPNTVAVKGTTTGGTGTIGVLGKGDAVGVRGEATWTTGTPPAGVGAVGVQGKGQAIGVIGEGETWHGVVGFSSSTTGGFGVYGMNTAGGTGVVGESKTWMGVYGRSESTTGGAGVMAESVGTGAALYARGGRVAGYFEGDVEVTGDLRLTQADCAEDFTIGGESAVEPGTVMVVGADGVLLPSATAYDKRVAGVVSGAGEYKPAIVLDRQQADDAIRQPIALVGKVYCKVDAQYGAIEVGDLLTTSATHGHAMKAADPMRAFGAVIGKALRPLRQGTGLVPLLIALQ